MTFGTLVMHNWARSLALRYAHAVPYSPTPALTTGGSTMTRLQNVLFARDFSPSSEHALAYALKIAKQADATLHIVAVRVLERDVFGRPHEPAKPLERLREHFKERSRGQLLEHGFDPESLRVHHHLVRDEAIAPALLDYAETHNIDLVVMGTHGRRGVRRALLGSVTEEVLRQAPCPVLAVQGEGETAEAAPAEPSIKRIIVPIDFAKPARSALRYAAGLASAHDAQLVAMHVVEEMVLPRVYGIEPASVGTADQAEKVAASLQQLVEDTGITSPVQTHVAVGLVASAIIDFASEPGDLIVMATHGRTGLKRAFMGSVAERVMRLVKVPIIAAMHFEHQVESPALSTQEHAE